MLSDLIIDQFSSFKDQSQLMSFIQLQPQWDLFLSQLISGSKV